MGKKYLEQELCRQQAARENLFIPYIMAGDGGLDILPERIQFLKECGASAIELGIPFSDPVADGPTIQDAGIRALKNGATLSAVFEKLADTKEKRAIPIIFMTYLNPIYVYGLKRFAAQCKTAGVDGVIIPDLPLEEEAMVCGYLKEHNIAMIRLAALTSPKPRLEALANRSEGFLYAVSVTGTTGARASHGAQVQDYLRMLKQTSPVPVLAGFGVSTPEQARQLASSCDGVIVGSRIVELFHKGKTQEIKELIQQSKKIPSRT